MTLRLAIFGQAPFGREVTEKLAAAGHTISAVYAPPDAGRPDPLGALAEKRDWPLFRYKRFRRKGAAIPEILEEYLALDVDLNVLPFTTAIMPDEIVNAPAHGSLCFHPSLLPAYRGGAALSWQIIMGARESGVSVFKVTEGVDAGPLVVQHGGVEIGPMDTMGSLYFNKLYPLGVEAMLEAVAAVADGSCNYRDQSEEGASEQGLVNDDVSRIDWTRSASEIERLIRGCDPSPGARATLEGESIALFGACLEEEESTEATGTVLGERDGRLMIAGSGGSFSIEKVRRDGGKKIAIGELGLSRGARFG